MSCGRIVLGSEEGAAIALPEGAYVRLRFEDDGRGMDRETQRRVFEPFFTSRADEGGMGLGLATVFALVNGASGRIEVESEPGRGSVFSIYWPLSAESEAIAPAARAGADRVLVVDDEAAVLEAVGSMLERGGFEVRCATGPDQARRIAAADPEIDLVLCDVHLGAEDGPALADALAELLPQATFLFMSGYPEASLDERVLARLIAKPFTMRELFARMRALGVDPPERSER